MTDSTTPRVVAVARGIERSDAPGRQRGEHQEALNAWIGRWLNDGCVLDDDGSPGTTITTSDVYDWAPGGFFVVHTAYGPIGDLDVGGTEIIGYDEVKGHYVSHFLDSQGNASISSLEANGDTWTFQGETTRATVEFSDTNRTQTVLHERSDDGNTYRASMRVTLTEVV
jgi:hypothetical protein